MADLLSIDAALERVLAHARPLATEDVPLERSAGRVLAEDAFATIDLPPFANSAMDGFAIRAEDVPGTLPVAGRIAAGLPADAPLGPGETMGIATGAVVPAGADTVVPLEVVVDSGNSVEFFASAIRGSNVRPRGGDLPAGALVVAAGTRLGPAQLGALAAAGVAVARCARRPRVALLTTGSELRQPGTTLAAGQVYEANGVALAAALAAAGAEVEWLPPVEDDPAAHREALGHGLQADVLVTSGGVSVGPHDLVRATARELGVEEVFWGVAVRPGKPLAFGVRGATLVFGLPGNPLASLVSAELFVRPALLALQGHAEPRPRFEAGELTSSLHRADVRDELVRARALVGEDGTVSLEPLTGQESHMIARAAAATALVLVPRGTGELPAGSIVRYLRLG